MRSTLRRGLLLSLLLALTLPLVSCDSGGSGDSSPAWVGSWNSPVNTEYWNLSQEELEIIDSYEGCDIRSIDITEMDGNIITLDNPDGGIIEWRLEVSGDNMTVTVLENDEDPNEVGEEFTVERLEQDPRDLAGC